MGWETERRFRAMCATLYGRCRSCRPAAAVVRQFVMIWGISFERAAEGERGSPYFLPSFLPSLELLLLRLLRENLICSIDKRGKREEGASCRGGVWRGDDDGLVSSASALRIATFLFYCLRFSPTPRGTILVGRRRRRSLLP